MKFIPFIAILLSLYACNTKTSYPAEVLGYAPVYSTASQLKDISVSNAQPYKNPGKIYKYGNYTFQMDNGAGIHVINSSDPNNPQKVKFINVPGCTEISIKNDILYTDNYRDLVAININNLNNIVVSHRTADVFPGISQTLPPVSGVYFECVDPSKGIITGWTSKMIQNPKCFKP